MSAFLGFFPRVDSATSVSAARFDITKFGEAKGDPGEPAYIPKLGRELTDANANEKIGGYLRRRLGEPTGERDVQDAATAFVTNALRVMLPTTIEREGDPKLFIPGAGEVLIPQKNLLPLGANKVAYKIRELTGQAQFMDPNDTRALPRTGYVDDEAENGASFYGISWAVNEPETWSAALLNDDPLAIREKAAVRALDNFREDLSSFGNVQREIPGFLALPDAILVLGGQEFKSFGPNAETMMQRLAEFNSMYVQVNNREPTHLVAPERDKAAMGSTFFGGAGSTGLTVWEKASAMYPWLRNARWDNRLARANQLRTASRWVMWTQDSEKLYQEHHDTMVFGPFQDQLETVFVGIRRHGGTVAMQPEIVFNIDFST